MAGKGWSKRFDEPIVLDDGTTLTTVVRDKMNKQIAFELGATERTSSCIASRSWKKRKWNPWQTGHDSRAARMLA
jgi:FixJ family two-component response regulator